MRAEWVESGVLRGTTGTLGLPCEGRVGRGDRGHGSRPLRVKVALVGLALRSPDGAKQTGHGRQAAGPGEVRLWRKRMTSVTGSSSVLYTDFIIHSTGL